MFRSFCSANGTQQVATTGSDGSYEFDTLLDTYFLTVGQSPGIDRQQVVLSASNLDQTFNFSLTGAIVSGTVVGARRRDAGDGRVGRA